MIVLALCFIPLAVSACRGGNVISPEAFAGACDQFGYESYDEREEFVEDIGKERLLGSGMYISAEDNQIRKILSDEDVNKVFADIETDALSNLYSRDMETASILVMKSQPRDGAYYAVCGVAASFGSGDDAGDYYDSMVSKYEDSGNSVSNTDGSVEYTQIIKTEGRNMVWRAFYISSDNVLSFAGYARKTNDMAEDQTELCDILGIPSADFGDTDLTKIEYIEHRVKNAAQILGAETIEASRHEELNKLPPKPYYASTTSLSEMGMQDDKIFGSIKDGIVSFDFLYNINSSSDDIKDLADFGGYFVCEYKMTSEDKAVEAFGQLCDGIEESNEKLAEVETGNDGGIDYYRSVNSNNLVEYRYLAYREGDTIYLIVTMAFGSSSGIGNYGEVVKNADELEQEIISYLGF